MSSFLSPKRYVIQLILIFLLFTMGTVIALGIPVGWLLDKQTDQQLHALIDQSNQTTLALLENKTVQLQNLALLLMERPTLNQLIAEEGNVTQLSEYLDEFLENAAADGLLICHQNNMIASSGGGLDSSFCISPQPEGFNITNTHVWLISSAASTNPTSSITKVIVGQEVGSILQEFHIQSGLDYYLFYDGEQIASNLVSDRGLSEIEVSSNLEQYDTLSGNGDDAGNTYMSTIIPLSNYPEFELIGLLNIESYTSLNRQFRNIIIVTVSAVSLIGAAIAILVSRRISKPINQLARSAAALREGDLATPLATSSNTWEIAQLTNALEDARVSLKHSLYQLRKEKAWIEDLLDSIVEGLLTIDNDARITFTSQSISDITGVEASAMLGRLIDRFFVSSSGEELFSHQIPTPNQSRRIPVIIDGKELLLSVSASEFVPPEAGNATRALLIRDVTDEERIHKLIGEFMANITHEFRTPLTALSASVELLIDQLPTLSTKEIKHLLMSLKIGIVNLQALIDNLIEAASIEAGRFKVYPKPLELNAIIKDAIDTIQPIARKHNVQIVPPKQKLSFLVMADRRRTAQALLNLLSNAVKHSPDKGNITIRTLILKKHVMLEVHDEGSGVPLDFQSHLFNRFISSEQEENSSDLGHGLGLSVVKAVIEAQHGEVGFKNKENEGAIFWFTLPMIEGPKKMKALIVDDDRTLADLIDFTLRRAGFESYLAYDISSALELFKEKSVDIIILDVNLPGKPGIKNGFDLCQRIRQTSNVPIILLTVRDEEEDILKGLDIGADDYILKPFSPRQLVARIKTVLRRSNPEQPEKKEPFTYQNVIFDPGRREFTRKGQTPIKLTRLESYLLEYLMLNVEQILLTENIIAEVWGPGGGSTEMLRQLVRRLRVKIEDNPSEPTLIINLPRLGYGFGVK